MARRCHRCGGNLYSDDPTDPKSLIWCLQCGEWIAPPGFKPMPYIAMPEESYVPAEWTVDEHGDFIDIIDLKIEALVQPDVPLTVSAVAKAVHCSNSEARFTLERLVRNGTLMKYTYGPQNRWIAYVQKSKE